MIQQTLSHKIQTNQKASREFTIVSSSIAGQQLKNLQAKDSNTAERCTAQHVSIFLLKEKKVANTRPRGNHGLI